MNKLKTISYEATNFLLWRENWYARIITLIIIGILLSFKINNLEIYPPLADAQKYIKFSGDLRDHFAFLDNPGIVVPSIGFPFLLMVNFHFTDQDMLLYFSIISSVILFSISALTLIRIPLFSLLITFLYIQLLPFFIQFNVESGILLSSQFFLTMLVWSFKKQHYIFGIIAGLALAFFIFVRPMFLPLLYLLSAGALIFIIIKKGSLPRPIKQYHLILATALISVFLMLCLSYTRNGDSRFVSGTYGVRDLYISFNKYINLKTPYITTSWEKLPEEIKQEALDPLNIRTTWQEREQRVQSLVIDYIKNNPREAFEAYLYRLKQYTTGSNYLFHKIKFWLLIISFLFAIFMLFKINSDIYQWFSLFFLNGLYFYILVLQSFWPYIGERYFLIMTPFCMIAICFNLSTINPAILEKVPKTKVTLY